jgi:hypothetical protein
MENCFGPIALVREWIDPASQSLTCASILYESASPPTLSLTAYLITFAMTVALESPLYWFILRRDKIVNYLGILGGIILGNMATHPFVVFLWPRFCEWMNWQNLVYVGSAELIAPVVETFVIKRMAKISFSHAATSAFAANLFSWWLGSIIF